MKRLLVVVSVFVALPLLAQLNVEFKPKCDPPMPDAKKQKFDDRCGIEGVGQKDQYLLQNKVKNRFCTNADHPALVTFASFKRLQAMVEDPGKGLGPKYSEPKTRTVLENIGYKTTKGATIGEGAIVRIAGWLHEARYSNVGKGEGVNCKLGGKKNNDIHIVVMPTKSEDDECMSLSAEMSPHYRPTLWAENILNGIHRPVRFTGQLFFDASHKPCHDDKRPTPSRFSNWEIHPVYNIEVCKLTSLKSCKADDDSVWMTLEDFENPAVKSKDEDDEGDEGET